MEINCDAFDLGFGNDSFPHENWSSCAACVRVRVCVERKDKIFIQIFTKKAKGFYAKIDTLIQSKDRIQVFEIPLTGWYLMTTNKARVRSRTLFENKRH